MRAWLASYWTPAGRAALRNLVGLGAATGLSLVAMAGTMYLLAQHLSRADTGDFGVAQTLQTFLFFLCQGGFGLVALREGTQKPDQLDAITTAHFTWVTIAGLASFASVLLWTQFGDHNSQQTTLLLLFAGGNLATCWNLTIFFDRFHRQALVATLNLTAEAMTFVAILVLSLRNELTAPRAAWVFVAKWLVIALLHFAVYHRWLHRIRWVWDAATMRSLFASAWPIMLTGCAALVPTNGGIFFVDRFHTKADSGDFWIAWQIANTYAVIAGLATRILYPHIAGPWGTDRSFVRKLMSFAILFLVGLGVAAGLGAAILFTWLLPEYSAALGPALLLIVAAGLMSVCGLANCYLIRAHRERQMLTVYVGMAAAFALGCWWVVPEYAGWGAGIVAIAVVGTGAIALIAGLTFSPARDP